MAIIDKELQFLCLKIPIKVLRAKLPELKSRKRQDFIDTLYEQSPEELRRLAVFYDSIKASSMFIYKLKDVTKGKITKESIDKLIDKEIESEGGQIFLIKQSVLDETLNELFIKIRGFSPIRKLKAFKPDSLKPFEEKYRNNFSIYLLFHLDTNHVEFRTGYLTRAENISSAISQKVLGNKDAFELIKLTTEQQNKIQGKVLFKKAIISDMEWHGCENIILEGEDIGRTITEFEGKGIKFSDIGKVSFPNRRS